MAVPASSIMDLISQISPHDVSASLSMPLTLGHVGALTAATPTSMTSTSTATALPSLSAILRGVVPAATAASQALATLGDVGHLAERSQLPVVARPLDLAGSDSIMVTRPEDEIAASQPRKRHGKRFKQDEDIFSKATALEHAAADSAPFSVRHGLAPQTWTKRHERSRKSIRVPWTKEETDALERGVMAHSTRWSRILNDPALQDILTANARSSVDLKDKWRNWSKTLRKQRNPLGWVGSKELPAPDILAQAMQSGIPLAGTPAEDRARAVAGTDAGKSEGGRPARPRAEPSAASQAAVAAASAASAPPAAGALRAAADSLPVILPIPDASAVGLAGWEAALALSSTDPAGIANAIAKLTPASFGHGLPASVAASLGAISVTEPMTVPPAAALWSFRPDAAPAKRPRDEAPAASSSAASLAAANETRLDAEAEDAAAGAGEFRIVVVNHAGEELLRLRATADTALSQLCEEAASALGEQPAGFFLVGDAPVHAYSCASTATVAAVFGPLPCAVRFQFAASRTAMLAMLAKQQAENPSS